MARSRLVAVKGLIVEKSLKFIENRCTHCAMRSGFIFLQERVPIAQKISDMLDIGRKPSQLISIVYFTSKIGLNRTLCDCFRWWLLMYIDRPIDSHRKE